MFSLPATPYNTFEPDRHLPIVSSPLSSSPIRPSPLSPRSVNIRSRAYPMSSPIPQKPKIFNFSSPTAEEHAPREKVPFSRRGPVKKNPLMERKTPDDARETRRKVFLNRVRESSEDKRWEARGGDDEIMRLLWVAEERRRQESMKREALRIDQAAEFELEEDEIEQPTLSTKSIDEEMADEVAQREQEELEALLASLEQQEDPPNTSCASQALETPYGSDDDEYDDIFMEILGDEAHFSHPSSQVFAQIQGSQSGEVDMMDMS